MEIIKWVCKLAAPAAVASYVLLLTQPLAFACGALLHVSTSLCSYSAGSTFQAPPDAFNTSYAGDGGMRVIHIGSVGNSGETGLHSLSWPGGQMANKLGVANVRNTATAGAEIRLNKTLPGLASRIVRECQTATVSGGALHVRTTASADGPCCAMCVPAGAFLRTDSRLCSSTAPTQGRCPARTRSSMMCQRCRCSPLTRGRCLRRSCPRVTMHPPPAPSFSRACSSHR